jgi:hypothetical protein
MVLLMETLELIMEAMTAPKQSAAKKVAQKKAIKRKTKAQEKKDLVAFEAEFDDGNDPPKMEPLTPDGRLFAQEYIIDFNPAQAVYRANLRPGRKAAGTIGQEYLEKPAVLLEIRKLLDKSEELTVVTRSRVLGKLWEEANNQDSTGLNWNKAGSRLKALDSLSKMMGYNEPEKHEVDTSAPVLNLILAGTAPTIKADE